ncbi:thiolase-like protein [Bipolaris maydis]|nr:thiolase-like protein [Bipolaris maydis]
MIVKIGCSASLVALHLAVKALGARSCSAAIVIGCNLMTSPLITVVYTKHRLLSKTGKCKTFDVASDGYRRGEAVNAVYIKRLSDAIRDGNTIRAVIWASATNYDGRKIRMLNLNTLTGFFKCYGIGMLVGDPLKVGAVANVFGESGVLIRVIKLNVGHSEGAAGILSTIKAILTLEHKTIPPNIYFNIPNPRNHTKRISVNSFRVGGSNTHIGITRTYVILESYHAELDRVSVGVKLPKGPCLLVFSVSNSKSLAVPNLDDLAYTLGCRRDHLAYRGYAICNGLG